MNMLTHISASLYPTNPQSTKQVRRETRQLYEEVEESKERKSMRAIQVDPAIDIAGRLIHLTEARLHTVSRSVDRSYK